MHQQRAGHRQHASAAFVWLRPRVLLVNPATGGCGQRRVEQDPGGVGSAT